MALQEELESQGNWLFRYRSLLPLTMLAAGMAVYLITIHTSGFFYSLLQPYWPAYEYTCLLVSLLGVGIRAYTVGHTPAGTSGRNTAEQVAESLNTTGICSTCPPLLLEESTEERKERYICPVIDIRPVRRTSRMDTRRHALQLPADSLGHQQWHSLSDLEIYQKTHAVAE